MLSNLSEAAGLSGRFAIVVTLADSDQLAKTDENPDSIRGPAEKTAMRSYVSIGRGGPRFGLVFSSRGRRYGGQPLAWGPALLAALAFSALSFTAPAHQSTPPDPLAIRIPELSRPVSYGDTHAARVPPIREVTTMARANASSPISDFRSWRRPSAVTTMAAGCG